MSNVETKMTAEELARMLRKREPMDGFPGLTDLVLTNREAVELINAYTAPLTAEVERAYREGFQDGREWAMDDSEVGEDAFWEKSQAKAALDGKGGE